MEDSPKKTNLHLGVGQAGLSLPPSIFQIKEFAQRGQYFIFSGSGFVITALS
jgi:hypothetical protein